MQRVLYLELEFGNQYRKASGNGAYPANARQVMYAARGEILELTGNSSLDDQYFTQTLLPNYIRDHPQERPIGMSPTTPAVTFASRILAARSR